MLREEGAEGPWEAGGGRLHAHRGPRRRPRLPAPAAPEALAPGPRPRLLRRRLLREGGLPPRGCRPPALLGGDDVAGGREPLRGERAALRADGGRSVRRR